jgi:hypothetical protein
MGSFKILYSSPDFIRLIKLWRRGWAGNLAHKEKKRNAYRTRVRNWNKETIWNTHT